MKKSSYFLFFLIVSLWSNFASANGFMRLGAMYMAAEDGTGTKATRTLLDLGMGYVNPKGWTIGFLYGTEKSDYGSFVTDRSALGPSVGWVSRSDSGFYALGTYFYAPTTSDGLKGKGYQFDVGYKFLIYKISFAAQLSKKHFDFDELNGTSLSPSIVDDKIDPYFVFTTDF